MALKGNLAGFNSQQMAAIAALFSRGQDLTLSIQTPAADGVWDGSTLVLLGTGIDITGMQPSPGKVVLLWCTDSTTNATAACPTGCTWEGTNDLATFEDAGDALLCVGISNTRWAILANVGSVPFS